MKQKAKWAAVEGDQNASTSTQLVKQKAKWAAIEDGGQTAALPRHQEEEETDKTKQAQSNKHTKSTKISSLVPKRGNRNA